MARKDSNVVNLGIGLLHEPRKLAEHPVARRFGELRQCVALSGTNGDYGIEVVRRCLLRREQSCIVGGEAVLLHEAGLPSARQLRQVAPNTVDPFPLDHERRKVGLREVAVVRRPFLDALGDRYALLLDPATSLLDNPLATAGESGLPVGLIRERAEHRAEAVHVLDLDLRAELGCSLRTDADVRVAAEATLFHVGGARADVAENRVQRREVGAGLFSRAHVRFADGLHQRDSRAVDVEQAITLPAVSIVVGQLRHVLFKVDAIDPNRALRAVHVDGQLAVLGDWLVEL